MSPFQSGPSPEPRPRCHFPTTPVVYPAAFSTEGNVVRPGSMMRAALPGAIPVPFLRQAYSPVNRPYRDGVHVDDGAWTRVNFNPSEASRSTLGVRIRDAP